MQMISRFVSVFLLALGVTAMPARAQGATSDCPATAEQSLFNIQLALYSGQVKDAQVPFSAANQAVQLCVDRADVQALAVELFALVGSSVSDPEGRLAVWSKAWEASANNDVAYKDGPTLELLLGNGAKQKIYTFARTRELLREKIMYGLIAAADGGELHPMFTEAAVDRCPYVTDGQARARDEADGLVHAAQNRADAIIQLVAGRLQRLGAACAEQSAYMTYSLGELYFQSANYQAMLDDKELAKSYAAKAMTHFRSFEILGRLKRRDEDLRLFASSRRFKMDQLIKGHRE